MLLLSLVDSVHPPADISFSIILLFKSRVGPLRETIESFLKHPPEKAFEFILVGRSIPSTARQLVTGLAAAHRVRLLLTQRSSFSQDFNLGAQSSRGRLLIFANSAIGIRLAHRFPDFASGLADPTIGLVGWESLWKKRPSKSMLHSRPRRQADSSIPCSGLLLGVRAESFWEVGGLDERFASESVSLLDLQFRLVGANYRLMRLRELKKRSRVAAFPDKISGSAPQPLPRAELQAFRRKHRDNLSGLKDWKELFAGHRPPKFSVAIATRNYGRWLPRCLDSVLGSHNPSRIPLQITVVDDCSTDNTKLILEEYGQKHPGVFTLLRPATSRGISAVKNAAIRRCTGEYVALLDADDEFLPEKLARCAAALKAAPKADFLTHDYRFIDAATGETFVPGDEWYGNWRPPGVWVFRSGRVNFSEQMICGYEELEWSERFWRGLRRIHMPAVLAIVHGEHVGDRWKFDRAVAGTQGFRRWRPAAKKKRGDRVFGCRVCGSQYFQASACCDLPTEEVPLVCYMAVSSLPYFAPVEFSIVIFTADNLAATKKLCKALRQDPETQRAEWIFVQCHPRRGLINFFRELSQTARVKAIFAPNRDGFIYGHDVNRAARVADGKYLVLLANNLEPRTTGLLCTVRTALSELRVGVVGHSPAARPGASNQDQRPGICQFTAGPVRRCAWAMRQDVFWELGAMDERFESDGIEMLELQYRALKAHYRLSSTQPFFCKDDGPPLITAEDRALFKKKHLCSCRRRGKRVEPFASFPTAEISIAIATRNAARCLHRCLDSVLQSRNPTGVPFQIVVVNDCSTDDTRLILEGYRQRFSDNFTLIHTERAVGPARARNLALARCTGKYIAGLHVQAEFLPDKLAICWERLRPSGVDFLFHDRVWRSNRSADVRRLAPREVPSFSTWMFRNGVVRLNEQMLMEGSDLEWFSRRARQLRLIHVPLALTILHPGKGRSGRPGNKKMRPDNYELFSHTQLPGS